MNEDDDQADQTDEGDERRPTDAELAQEFTDYYDRSGQLARSSLHLTAEERRRVQKITTDDLAVAFDLDAVCVRRVQRLRRKMLPTPLQKGQKRSEADLRDAAPQQVSRGQKTSCTPTATRIDRASPTPREGVAGAQIHRARAS